MATGTTDTTSEGLRGRISMLNEMLDQHCENDPATIKEVMEQIMDQARTLFPDNATAPEGVQEELDSCIARYQSLFDEQPMAWEPAAPLAASEEAGGTASSGGLGGSDSACEGLRGHILMLNEMLDRHSEHDPADVREVMEQIMHRTRTLFGHPSADESTAPEELDSCIARYQSLFDEQPMAWEPAASLAACEHVGSQSQPLAPVQGNSMGCLPAIEDRSVADVMAGVTPRIGCDQRRIESAATLALAASAASSSELERMVSEAKASQSLQAWLACANAAVKLSFENLQKGLRPCQLVALALLLEGQRSTLLQIMTGEGKSIIIAALAAILACKRMHVDVHTSAEYLAEREVEGPSSKRKLFSAFGVSVAHNINHAGCVASEPRECYKSEVVYGTTHSFIFDVLGDEYSKHGNMNGRKQRCAIVDEVDNLFLDRADGAARLAGRAVGFDGMELALLHVWKLVLMIEVDEEGSTFTYMHDTLSQEQLVATVAERARLLCDDAGAGEGSLRVGRAAKKYLCEHSVDLVKRAMHARFCFKNGRDYVVKGRGQDRRIMLIDYNNTGEELDRTTFCKGLHQFLEFKERLPTTSPFTLQTNFLSLAAMFKRYELLLGLSGTLGSQRARRLLEREYDVRCFDVPTNRIPRRDDLPALELPNWQHMQEVMAAVLRTTTAGRPALVVAEDVNHAALISEQLSEICPVTQITNQRQLDKWGGRARPGEVIVSTNLLGRGADIDICKEAEEKGGLHVVVTFKPPAHRTLLQAFGRSARKGQPGSAQLIFATVEATALGYACEHADVAKLFNEERFFGRMQQQMADNDKRDKVFMSYLRFLDSGVAAALAGPERSKSPLFRAINDKFGVFVAIYGDSAKELEQRYWDFERGVYESLQSDRGKNELLSQAAAHLLHEALDVGGGREGVEGAMRAVALCREAAAADPHNYRPRLACGMHMLRANRHEDVRFSRDVVLGELEGSMRLQEAQSSQLHGRMRVHTMIVAPDHSAERQRFDLQAPVELAPATMHLDLGDIDLDGPIPADGGSGLGSAGPASTVAAAPGAASAEVAAGAGAAMEGAAAAPGAAAAEECGSAASMSSLQTEVDALQQSMDRTRRMIDSVKNADHVADVDAIAVDWSGTQVQQEQLAEGLVCPEPAPRKRPSKGGGSWWPIVLGALQVLGGALTLSVCPWAAAALMTMGVKDICLGAYSLHTGQAVDFKNYLISKIAEVGTAAVNFLAVGVPFLQDNPALLVGAGGALPLLGALGTRLVMGSSLEQPSSSLEEQVEQQSQRAAQFVRDYQPEDHHGIARELRSGQLFGMLQKGLRKAFRASTFAKLGCSRHGREADVDGAIRAIFNRTSLVTTAANGASATPFRVDGLLSCLEKIAKDADSFVDGMRDFDNVAADQQEYWRTLCCLLEVGDGQPFGNKVDRSSVRCSAPQLREQVSNWESSSSRALEDGFFQAMAGKLARQREDAQGRQLRRSLLPPTG